MNAIGGLQSCILLYDLVRWCKCTNSIRLCICTLDLINARVEPRNSFTSINVILDMKMLCFAFIKSFCDKCKICMGIFDDLDLKFRINLL